MLCHKSKYAPRGAIAQAREVWAGDVAHLGYCRTRADSSFWSLACSNCVTRGFCTSRKGKGGCYFLAREPAHVTLGEILRVVEGPLAPIPCVSKTADMRRRECRDENTCGIRMVMKDMRNATARILDSTTLADVLSRVAGSVNGKPTLTYDF